MTHESKYTRTEDLHAVVSTMPLSDAGSALVPGAGYPFVHGDVVVETRHDLARVQRQKDLYRRSIQRVFHTFILLV